MSPWQPIDHDDIRLVYERDGEFEVFYSIQDISDTGAPTEEYGYKFLRIERRMNGGAP